MKSCRTGAVVIVQNDAETIEPTLASFYDHVERIFVSTDPKRGWSGVPITPDDTIERIRAMDYDNKITIIEDDFVKTADPMANETNQRQVTADSLAEQTPGLDWILQIDADEVFLDFPYVLRTIAGLPPMTRAIYWKLLLMFNTLDDGRFLVVVDEARQKPMMEVLPLGHRPGARLRVARNPFLPHSFRGLLRWRYDYAKKTTIQGDNAASRAVLHYSFAKSEARIYEKLKTWGHSKDFDTDAFFALWQRSKTDWESIRNFHPVTPELWPALRPYHLHELTGG